MKIFIIDKLPRILKNKKNLEKTLNIKITNRGKEISIEGKSEDEYIAEKVIDAIDFGFPIVDALLIRTQDHLFEIINIKDHTTSKNLQRIRARIIGAEGKALKTLTQLCKCNFEIKDNQIGIIGDAEYIKNAQDAMILLIRGTKHANVYKLVESRQVQPVLDLGLKEKTKKQRPGEDSNF